VEDAGLLQHGALLDAEERRVVLCSSNQASERSANRNGDGRRDPRRIAPDLGRCDSASADLGTYTRAHTTGGAHARNEGTGRDRLEALTRAHAPSSSRSSSFFTTSGCAMAAAAAAVGATRAREGARAGGGARGFPRGPGGGLAGFGVEEARSLQEWRIVRHGSESGAGKGDWERGKEGLPPPCRCQSLSSVSFPSDAIQLWTSTP
jgi:hypothetical protein